MLVLSRREHEKIRFPSLGISMEILRIRGKTAKVGISAPEEIPVIRDELATLKSVEFTPDQATTNEKLAHLVHAVRQQLESASDELCRLHQLLEKGDCAAAEQHVMAIHRHLRGLEAQAEAAVESSPFDSSINALVVDADERERQLLEAFLHAHHVNVATASDGQDALDHLNMHAAPDVILLDMEMPMGDGPSLVSRRRAQPELEAVKIFALTAQNPAVHGQSLSSAAIDSWFVKPVNHDQIVSELIARVSQPVTVA